MLAVRDNAGGSLWSPEFESAGDKNQVITVLIPAPGVARCGDGAHLISGCRNTLEAHSDRLVGDHGPNVLWSRAVVITPTINVSVRGDSAGIEAARGKGLENVAATYGDWGRAAGFRCAKAGAGEHAEATVLVVAPAVCFSIGGQSA